MYNKKVFFHLPDAFGRWQIYDILINLYLNNKNYFYDNVYIGSLYGVPNGAIWNSGRGCFGNRMTPENLISDRDFVNKSNIPVRFTFTNSLLEERHLQDEYCNLILELFSNGNNEIICNSPILEKYIRDKYGDKYKYISSTTKCILDKDQIQKEIDKYYLTVLDYNFNNNYDFLKKINSPNKIEILINPVCNKGCQRRKEHYENISKSQLLGFPLDFECPFQGRLFYEAKKNELFVSKEKINDWYLEHDFSNFKIEGRTTKCFDLIEILIYYMIKDEYKDEVREQLLAGCYNY